MTVPEQSQNQEVAELARTTHYTLREKLMQLRYNPPSEPVQGEMLNNEVASHMRQLDDYHAQMFTQKQQEPRVSESHEEPKSYTVLQRLQHLIRKNTLPSEAVGTKEPSVSSILTPDEFLNPYVIPRLKQYHEWRRGKLRGGFVKFMPDDSRQLREADPERWSKFFNEEVLYTTGDSGPYGNHWIFCVGRDIDGKKVWATLGDLHKDLTFTDIMSGFRKGFETKIFYGSQLNINGKEGLTHPCEDNLPGEPKGTFKDGEPQVTITQDGHVIFNL